MAATTTMAATVEEEGQIQKPSVPESELEEGEIIDNNIDGAVTEKPSKGVPRHPLENSWTFWFDNPSAKSKQTTWASYIRPIYTFGTVEEFWRVNSKRDGKYGQ